MSALSRAVIPLVALTVGTWIGLGRPAPQTALAAGARAIGYGVPGPRGIASPAVPPLEREPSVIDSSALADPSPPWPELNPQDSAERAWLVTEGPAHAPRDGRRLVTFT